MRHRVDDGGLHLAAAPPFADRAHSLRGRAARRGAGHGHPRNPQPRFRKRRPALDERRQLPGQPHGAGVVRALQPAGGLRTAHARAPRGGLRLLFLPPRAARPAGVDALLLARRRQIDRRAEPLHLPARLRERISRPEGRGGRGCQPRRDRSDRGPEGRGDHAASRTLHRPRIEGHAFADGFLPLCGLPPAVLLSLRGASPGRRRDRRGGRRPDVRHDPSRRGAETLCPDRGRGAPRRDPAGDDPHG